MSTVVPGTSCTVLVAGDAHAPAGRPATLAVHVRSTADVPLDVTVHVRGLDDGWSPAPGVLAGLKPDATGTVELVVVAPAGAMAGEYACAVVVETAPAGVRATPQQTVAPATVTVDAPSRVVLAVEPAEARARLSRRVAVVLSNTGEDPVELELATRSDRGLHVDVPRHVRVPARSTTRVTARARILRPSWVGHRDRRGYEIFAHGSQAPATFRGGVTAMPFVTASMTRALALVLVVALWLGGLVVAVPRIRDAVGERTSPTPVATAVPGTPGTPGDPQAPDEDPGTGSDDPGETPSELAGTVRAAGLVTSDAPGGVTVRLTPYQGATGGPAEDDGTTTTASGVVAGQTQDDDGTTATADGGPSAPGTSASSFAAVARVLATALPGVRAADVARATAVRATAARATGTTDSRAVTRTPAGALVPETTSLARERSTRTLDDGTWAVAGLVPTATYLVEMSKPGYQTVRRVVTGVEAAAGLDAELHAGAGRLSGTVRGPGGAVGGATVTITDGTSTVTTSTRTRGDVGAWEVDGLSTPSTFLVTVTADGLGTASRLVTLGASGAATASMSLVHGEGSLAGSVTGPDGLGALGPVGGATVVVRGEGVERTVTTATAGRPGTYVVDGLPVPGEYTLEVSAPGHTSVTLRAKLRTGRATTRDVRLPASGAAVQGTVVAPDGSGLGGVGLTLTGSENTYRTMSSTEGTGAFRVGGMEPGTYVVTAESFGRATARTEVEVGPGGTASVRLTLAESDAGGVTTDARVRGRAVDARTNGQITCSATVAEECLVTATITTTNPDGTPRTVRVTTAPDLEYTIPAADEPGLAPGLYTVTLSAPGYEPGTVRVEVPMGRTVTATNVALYPSPSVVGTVQARVGSVPAGTCVVVSPTGTPLPDGTTCTVGAASDGTPTCTVAAPHRCAGTGTNGAYQVERLRAGGYTVTVLPGDPEYLYPVAATELTLVAGQVARFDATLERLGRVAVTALVDVGGSGLDPLPGALVTPVATDGRRGTTVTAGPSGAALLTHLAAGTYTVEVVAPDTGASARATGVEVALNQEAARPVVVASSATRFSGRVVTFLDGSLPTGLGGRTVTVTGIVGYDGVTAVRGSATGTTQADGTFDVGTDPAGSPLERLVLVSSKFDVVVDGDTVYEGARLTGTTVDTNGTVTLTLDPVARDFDGVVAFTGATGADLVNLAENVTYTVTSFPAGTSVHAPQVRDGAVADPSGSVPLVWGDTALGAPATGTGGLVRPGRYVVEASLPGFTSARVTYNVPVVGSGAVPRLVVGLAKHGVLAVRVVDAADGADVPGATMTLTLGGVTTTRTADGTAAVSFGTVAPGTYDVAVKAAGYRFVTGAEVVVVAGATLAGAVAVEVTRMGTISGKVTLDEAGTERAAEGVEVVASRGSTIFRTRTGPGGTYEITGSADVEGLAAGPWTVQAKLAGYVDASRPASVGANPGAVAADQNLVLVLAKVDVTIELVDVDGLGIDLGRVNVRPVSSAVLPPTCVPTGTGTCPDGLRVFKDVHPLPMNLLVTTDGGTSLTVQIVPVVGGTQPTILVPVTGRKNTVRVNVQGQAGGSAPVAVSDATVSLLAGATTVATQPGENDGAGVYVLDSIDAGSYTVEVAAPGYAPATRSVSVTGGQTVSVDVVLSTTPRQVTLVLTSVRGGDLTGAVVEMRPAGGGSSDERLPLGAQPVTRLGGDTYGTTFAQVPPGEWLMVVSGPTGHLWTITHTVLGTGGDDVAISVDEVRVRALVDASAEFAAEGGTTVPVTVAPASGAEPGGFTGATLTVVPGAGHEELWLLADAGGYTLTATVPAAMPWRVVGTPATGTGDVVLHGTLEPEQQQVSVTATNATVSLDAPTSTLTVTVAAPKNNPSPRGTVLVTLVSGATRVPLPAATLAANNGTATVTVDRATPGLAPGTWQVEVAYTSSSTARWANRTSLAPGATVTATATAGTLSAPAPTGGWVRGATFTVSSTRGAAVALTNATCAVGGGAETASVTIAAGGSATCTVAATPATEFTVRLTASSLPVNAGWETWTSWQSAALGTVAALPPDPDPNPVGP
ncbi:carboxypeptidase regulatory-like domain-containing protein [Sanguibacter sp. HDW7]|uniref:carboxypeptidase regulatory-like domain-containing protein n=1 Tax=Sanguibacter sp. HDW7 TaxID=2714931 RepID=UPI00140DA9FC|nr:carboxypeptidase regulatory-like domain-containing protein [Sanguibacter sp. HDW7]QIK83055.1 PEGA domain-containing protein [Sanguibacter sp. HDW7]